ncbi:hypothetical protein [Vibrio fluvialis]|jgi:hypothetical protein|uniref:hypothetical protein n=1 Tax=Vibrio fluvialis TaxID=676 RepID=UPI001EECD2FF|nr:hypothetical protein [Vibrio fluvialis]MCG6391806.1 hypothetical protein [Vibrio fluvialis]
MEARTANTLNPLINYLLNFYIDSNLTERNHNQIADLQQLNIALTRFIDAPDDVCSFELDSQGIRDVLTKCVSGKFSSQTGTEWVPGEPMHLSHLVGAMMDMISKSNLDRNIPNENHSSSRPKFHLV